MENGITRLMRQRSAPCRQRNQSSLIWRFAIMFGTFDIVIWGLLAWVPTYLVDARHVHLIATGVLVSIPCFAGAIGTILGGWVFDRVFHAHFRRLVVTAEVVSIIFLILVATASSVSTYVTFMTIPLLYKWPFYLFSVFPYDFSMASGSAIINFWGQAGGFLAPILMGILINQISYTAGFALLVFALAASVVTAFTIPESPDRFRKTLQHNASETSVPHA